MEDGGDAEEAQAARMDEWIVWEEEEGVAWGIDDWLPLPFLIFRSHTSSIFRQAGIILQDLRTAQRRGGVFSLSGLARRGGSRFPLFVD
jgi:hypothetical protein